MMLLNVKSLELTVGQKAALLGIAVLGIAVLRIVRRGIAGFGTMHRVGSFWHGGMLLVAVLIGGHLSWPGQGVFHGLFHPSSRP